MPKHENVQETPQDVRLRCVYAGGSLAEKYYKQRAAYKAAMKSTVSFGQTAPHPGCFDSKLADTVPIIVNGDYGADHSALSELHVTGCADRNILSRSSPSLHTFK